jgi:hypothetical protein
MRPAPDVVDGARVFRWTSIDERHRPTGNCRHIVVSGEVRGPAAGLAICQHDGEACFYLFGCDAEWSVVTDTWHATLEEALSQAEFEYEGVARTWNVIRGDPS